MTTQVTVTVAGHKVRVRESSGNETILHTQGDFRTFHVHQSNEIDISETGELSDKPKPLADHGGAEYVSQEKIDQARSA